MTQKIPLIQLKQEDVKDKWLRWPDSFDGKNGRIYRRKLGTEAEYESNVFVIRFASTEELLHGWEKINNRIALYCQGPTKALIERSNFYLCLITKDIIDEKERRSIEEDVYCAKKYVFQFPNEASWEEIEEEIENRIFRIDAIKQAVKPCPSAKISKLYLRNFRAYAGERRFDFCHESNRKPASLVLIYARNGSGKTSICDSLEWLLTDDISRLSNMEKEIGNGGMLVHNNITHSRLEEYTKEDCAGVAIQLDRNEESGVAYRTAGMNDSKTSDLNKRGDKVISEIYARGIGSEVFQTKKWKPALMPHHEIESFISATQPSDRYKEWIECIDPDNKMTREYQKSVTALNKALKVLRTAKTKEKEAKKNLDDVSANRGAVDELPEILQEYAILTGKNEDFTVPANEKQYRSFVTKWDEKIKESINYSLQCEEKLQQLEKFRSGRAEILKLCEKADQINSKAGKKHAKANDLVNKMTTHRKELNELQEKKSKLEIVEKSFPNEIWDLQYENLPDEVIWINNIGKLPESSCNGFIEKEEIIELIHNRDLLKEKAEELEENVRLQEKQEKELADLSQAGRRYIQSHRTDGPCECPLCHSIFKNTDVLLEATLRLQEYFKSSLDADLKKITDQKIRLQKDYSDYREKQLERIHKQLHDISNQISNIRDQLDRENIELTKLQNEIHVLLEMLDETEGLARDDGWNGKKSLSMKEVEKWEAELFGGMTFQQRQEYLNNQKETSEKQKAVLEKINFTSLEAYFSMYQEKKNQYLDARKERLGFDKVYNEACENQRKQAQLLEAKLQDYFGSKIFDEMYKKIDPHPIMKDMKYVIDVREEKDKAVPELRFEGSGLNNMKYSPEWYFSTAQLNIVTLSAFLSRAIGGKNKLPLDFIMIDDPVGHFDDMNILDFSDLIRCILEQTDKQIIITTHDETVYQIFARKLPPEYYNTRYIEI